MVTHKEISFQISKELLDRIMQIGSLDPKEMMSWKEELATIRLRAEPEMTRFVEVKEMTNCLAELAMTP